jgi:hypothetical protein
MGTLNLLGEALLKTLPTTGVRWSFCYGSKVLESKMALDSQLDVLVVVEDRELENWHKDNLQLNGLHYSTLNRILGNKYVPETILIRTGS